MSLKIFLIGFMGCGKSTLAPKLARKLGVAAYDLDSIIEAESQKSITSLFERNGESNFRTLEASVLRRFIEEHDSFVLATGGGTPCFEHSMELMNSVGITIYLELTAKALAHRIIPGKNKRPLLAHLDDDELTNYIHNKLEERKIFYGQSQIIIDGQSVKTEELIRIIKNHSR